MTWRPDAARQGQEPTSRVGMAPQVPPEAVASSQRPPAARSGQSRAPRRAMSPLAAGAIGFFAGIAVWHALGFWAFLTAVVGGQQTASSSVLAGLLLGKPTGQLTAARGRALDASANPELADAPLTTTPRQARSEGCITLTRDAGSQLAARQACPLGAGSVVSRRLAARGDRLPVRIQNWATATTAGPTSPAAVAQDRIEAATVLTQPPVGAGWEPSVTSAERAIITGSVR